MGYSETYCQFCGVSFAIARIRIKNEPTEAAWEYYGGDSYVPVDSDYWKCDRTHGSGCEVLNRGGEYSEHVAGPGCICENGYHGNRILVEEMKGCRTMQCLVAKTAVDYWQPEQDDEEFEVVGDYFLTGYGDGSPDMEPMRVIGKIRHGLSSILCSNEILSNLGRNDWGLPFHPTCFNIFRRAYLRRHERLEVGGLMKWWMEEATFEGYPHIFPRHPAVMACQQQWWNHEMGTEWLVANPVSIPDWTARLELTFEKDSGASNHTRGAEKVYEGNPPPRPKPEGAKSDVFEALPNELMETIMKHLSGEDLARLRLVTRAADLIPRLIFRDLIETEIPWFWELESMSSSTNWSRLYADLKRLATADVNKFTWSELRALKNRKRIWADVNYIIDRIQVTGVE